MSWLANIFGGGVTAVTKGVERVGGVFAENREARGERAHEADMAVLAQHASEFHQRLGRTWFDSLCDGLNRLPRPLITISILGLFVLAPIDPLRFHQIAFAYEAMPDGFWALLSIIVAFYFGGRMQLKSQQFKVKGGALQAAKHAVEAQKAFAGLAEDDAPTEGNRVVKAWLDRRQPAG